MDRPAAGPALRTDRYELTMVDAALAAGVADHRAVFEVSARHLPAGRRYGVVAGTGRLLEALPGFRFAPDDVAWLADAGVVSPAGADWLADYRFAGDVDGYPEGEIYFPGSPVLTVEAGFAEAVVLETLVLSILNFDTGVAGSAARMVQAAAGRRLVEMGSRRTHEEAAVAAARAAWIAGFDATSNLAAGRRYGIPTTGTAAHAFTLAFPDERAAFAAQVRCAGPGTTVVVDTYDVPPAIDAAVAVAGPGLGGIRIDSGDLLARTQAARAQLDALGATAAGIVLSGELDEHRIDELVRAGAAATAFGVGTHLVAGAGCRPPGFVYKLVAVADRPGADAPLRPVAKTSPDKATVGGRKRAWRRLDAAGVARAEVVVVGEGPPEGDGRPLQVPLVRAGAVVGDLDPRVARERAAASRAELPAAAAGLEPGRPAIPTVTLVG